MHFVFEKLFVRLILSARIDALLLIRLDGCLAESSSNEQGQELDINLITCYYNLVQRKVPWTPASQRPAPLNDHLSIFSNNFKKS